MPPSDWSGPVSKQALLDSFQKCGPGVLDFLQQVPEDGIKVWELLDMPSLGKWTDGRRVLIGDA